MKSITFTLSHFTALTFSVAALAASIDARATNTASFEALSTDSPDQQTKGPDPRIVRLQVLLDRAGASPGVIDGYFGDNLSKAVAGFEALQGLPVDGKLDPDVVDRLADDVPAVQAYAITSNDAKDLVESIPKDYAEQAKLEHLGYTSVAEKLGERFHMDIGLLKALNPTATFKPGETIAVAIPGPAKTGTVKSIEVRRRSGEAFAFVRIPMMPATYSDAKPATHSEFIPATIPA